MANSVSVRFKNAGVSNKMLVNIRVQWNAGMKTLTSLNKESRPLFVCFFLAIPRQSSKSPFRASKRYHRLEKQAKRGLDSLNLRRLGFSR